MDERVPEPENKKLSLHYRPTGAKLARNFLFGILRTLLVVPVPLLLTPFIIRHVGIKGFGVWAIFTTLNGLTSLADLGFLGTLTKHVSEHFTRENYVELARVVNTGLIIFMGVALFCVLCLNLAAPFLVTALFRQPPVPMQQITHGFRWVTIAVGVNLLAFPFASVTTGLQRFDLASLLSVTYVVAIAILAAAFLSFGYGIPGLAYAMAIAAVLNLAFCVAVARYLLPRLQISPRLVRLADIATLFSFSLQLYVIQMSVVVSSHLEKFLLARFAGLTPAGWYDIANDLSAKTRSFSSLMLAPFLPAAAELQARGDQIRMSELYGRTQKYLSFLNVGIFAAVALLAHRFMELWLGPGYSQTSNALIGLAGAGFVAVASAPGMHIFTSRGLLRPGVRAAGLGILLNLVLSTILIIYRGFAGAVYGTVFSLIISAVYFIVVFHRETGYPASCLLAPLLKPVTWAVIVVFSIKYLFAVNRLGWIGLIVTSAAFVTVYAVGLLLLRYFDAFDLQALEKVMPIPKLIRRIVLFA